METKPPLIELHDAVVRRKGKEILNVGDFTLQQGESIALIGPNGAGKSTFIHLITREVFPLHRDEPPVLFKGKSLVTLEEVKQCLGIVNEIVSSMGNATFGDGKIFIKDVAEAIRVRTGETGDAAL